MIVYETRIPYINFKDIIKIKPIFDVHLGNKFCDISAFKSFLSDSFDKSTYFTGGGDLLDCIITKDIKRYRKSSDGSEGDDIIDDQVNSMIDILMPYKDNIIGLGEGNHEDTILQRCGTNPIKRICDALNVPFLGYTCLVRLNFYNSTSGGGGRSVVIRQHHGWGGASRTRGANITKYERDMGKWDADIYLYGHVHQKQYDRVPRLGIIGDIGHAKLNARPQIMCICGTYLKTFSNDSNPTYSEKFGFPPVEIGGITIKIKITRRSYDIKVEL